MLPPPQAFPDTYFPAGTHLSLSGACTALCVSCVALEFHFVFYFTYYITGAQLEASSKSESSLDPLLSA